MSPEHFSILWHGFNEKRESPTTVWRPDAGLTGCSMFHHQTGQNYEIFSNFPPSGIRFARLLVTNSNVFLPRFIKRC